MAGETCEEVLVGADKNGNGGHIVKVVVPRTKMHQGQYLGIIGGFLASAAIIAALLAAFFMPRTEAIEAHGAINQTVGTHIAVDDKRDLDQDTKHAAVGAELKAVQHNVVKLGERLRIKDKMKTADDFAD